MPPRARKRKPSKRKTETKHPHPAPAHPHADGETEEFHNGGGDDHLSENDHGQEEEEENGDGGKVSHPLPVGGGLRTHFEDKPNEANGSLNDSETHRPYEAKDSPVDSVKNRKVQIEIESVEQNGRSEGGIDQRLVEKTPTDDSIEIAAEEDIPVEKISPAEASPVPDEIGEETCGSDVPLSPNCIIVQEGDEAISIQPPIFCAEIVDEHGRETPMDDSVNTAAEEGIPVEKISPAAEASPVHVNELVTDEIREKTCASDAALSPKRIAVQEGVEAISIQTSSPKIFYADIVDEQHIETPIDDSVKIAVEEGIPVKISTADVVDEHDRDVGVNEPLLEPAKTTFWNGCCGLFQVFRGSDRRNSW